MNSYTSNLFNSRNQQGGKNTHKRNEQRGPGARAQSAPSYQNRSLSNTKTDSCVVKFIAASYVFTLLSSKGASSLFVKNLFLALIMEKPLFCPRSPSPHSQISTLKTMRLLQLICTSQVATRSQLEI